MNIETLEIKTWPQIKFVTDILNNEKYLNQKRDSELQTIESKAREIYQTLDLLVSQQEIYLNLLNDVELTCSEILERRNDEFEDGDEPDDYWDE
jgi:hypothetical protein